MNSLIKTLLVAGGIAAVIITSSQAGEPPDLTKTNAADRTRTYNLGPTGLRGWAFLSYEGAPSGHFTDKSRQILVTHVGTNTPAFGVVMTNDVILGVGDTLFTADARKSFGRAITEAEKPENKGILNLLLFRAGQTKKVQLQLRVMGTYSDTAPYNCPKSARIMAEALEILKKEPLPQNWAGAVSGLALLASGDKSVLPKVQEFARSLAPGKLDPDGCDTWGWGYRNLFLTEYYLATGDKEVLPFVQELTINLAKAQSCFGTFGHRGAGRTKDGKLHGSIGGYGPVNPAGLAANLSIVLGKKCGIKDPEVDAAIARANRFFSYFVNKGCIPYGEHSPGNGHESNGKCAVTALFFALQGDQPDAARFFEKMATAAFASRDTGHTGQGFLHIWGVMGANIGGPAAAAAYVNEIKWQMDLARRPDGSFVYDGSKSWGVGRTPDNTYWGRINYNGLSPEACFVLSYAVPLHKLYITGRDSKSTAWLSKQDVVDAIAAEKFYYDRKQKSPEELVKAFESWSPAARSWAAGELASRPEAKNMEADLLKMAEGSNPNIQEGACDTLAYLKTKNAIPVFVRLLRSDNRWLRAKAAQGLGWLGPAARSALPDILKAMADTAEPTFPVSSADPVQIAQNYLSWTVFHGILLKKFDNVDRKLLYPAIRVAAKLPGGGARANLRKGVESCLTEADTIALAPDLFAMVDDMSPADRMFSDELRWGALAALTRYHFAEGLPLAIHYARTQNGLGSQGRTGSIMALIISYGTAAQDYLPELRKLEQEFKKEQFPDWAKHQKVAHVTSAIKVIEAATTEPALKSLKGSAKPIGPNANLPAIVPVLNKRKPGATPGTHTLVALQLSGSWSPQETSPKPKAFDWSLPDSVLEPGRYAVTFKWNAGRTRYLIHQVEIVQNGKVLAQDKHEGSTDNNNKHQDNVYHLDLPKPGTTPLILRATVHTEGGPSCAGQILIEKVK